MLFLTNLISHFNFSKFRYNVKNNIICYLCLILGFNTYATAAQFNIGYIKIAQPYSPSLSNVFLPPEDLGLQGAKLAIIDSNTTGKFLGQSFQLIFSALQNEAQLLLHLKASYQQGQQIFLLDMPAPYIMRANEWAKDKNAILFNVSAFDDHLRSGQCLDSVFHTIPSYAMKSDAIAQWLLARRLNKVLLVHGNKLADKNITAAFERSAKRFGIKIIEKKQWDFNTDLRRRAQTEIALFTQTRKEYDAVVLADAIKDFAEFFPYNTYYPRPVVGSAGLEALAWHPAIEQWGAAQLQNRFVAQANRSMLAVDFAAYIAIRAVSQSLHKNTKLSHLKHFLTSDNFQLSAYKGRKLSFRVWNRQLRMPLSLVHPHALVSQSPQPGMLHPVTDLDTLGFDQKETQCQQ